MDVRMMLQGLAPGVKNHGHTEFGAEMPGIGRDGGECLGRRAEQDRVDDGFVLERDLADRCRQCEDDMKVRHRQQFGLPIREPLGPRQPLAFGTVTVAARVVSDADCTAIVALLDMAAEHRRPARRDGAHDPSLDAPEMTGARRNASPWRRKTWMIRTSAPLSKRWVANVCRKVCTVTCLFKTAAAQAERQVACKTLGTSGRSSSR